MISPRTKKYFLLGDPIDHSLSPLIMNHLFQENNVDAIYFTMRLKRNAMEAVGPVLKILDIDGFNLTMPHKTTILKFIDLIDRDAKLIGAVNTVKKDGETLIGYNTDWLGVKLPLKYLYGDSYRVVALIGAGGAARAALYAVRDAESIYVLNRTFSRAVHISKELGWLGPDIRPMKLCRESLEEIHDKVDLIINATPVGWGGGEPPIPRDLIEPNVTVFDMVYEPLETKLIRYAREVGAKAIDGLWMLIYQAIAAFKIWTGIEADPVRLREWVEERLRCRE